MADYLAQKQKPILTDPDQQLETLLEKIRTGPHSMDLDRIRAAYEMARDAHAGQKRKDGSPYVTHSVRLTSAATWALMKIPLSPLSCTT